jgi:hypothetical protein
VTKTSLTYRLSSPVNPSHVCFVVLEPFLCTGSPGIRREGLLTLGWKFIARLSRISRSTTCFLTLAVVKVGLKFADIDNNHPMAGKTLIFDVDIIELPV